MRTEFHRASYICPEHPNCTDQTLKQAQTGTGHFHFSLLFYQKSTKSSVTTHFYSEITEVWILVVCNLIQTSLKAIGVTAPLQSKALLTLAGISCTTQINERTCNQYCIWCAQLILSFFDIIQNHSLYQTIHFSDEKKTTCRCCLQASFIHFPDPTTDPKWRYQILFGYCRFTARINFNWTVRKDLQSHSSMAAAQNWS